MSVDQSGRWGAQKRAALRLALSRGLDTIWTLCARLALGPMRADESLHIVTGADSSHAESLKNLLESIDEHESSARVTVWDLGLSELERKSIERDHPKFDLVRFDFGRYPHHLDLRIDAGAYAWKPVVISEAFHQSHGPIVWLDAGNLVVGRLHFLRRIVVRNGFFSPYSQGRVRQWTHPGTLDSLRADGEILGKRNCNGAILAFDSRQRRASSLLRAWLNCALDKNCIAPAGASLTNHRYDQAALTVLAAQHRLNSNSMFRNLRRPLGLMIHQDVE